MTWRCPVTAGDALGGKGAAVQSELGKFGRGSQGECDVHLKHSSSIYSWWESTANFCSPGRDPGAVSPVQVVDEVPHIPRQNDPVLPHVAVIPQHAYRNVGRHFRKLPQNIVECPSP